MGPLPAAASDDDIPMNGVAAELFAHMRSERDVADFLEDGPVDGMWIWDLEHPERVWTTGRFRELIGRTALPEDAGHEVFEHAHPADAAAAREAIGRCLADPSQPYDQVLRYRHQDGSTVWVRSRGRILKDEHGAPVRFVAVQSDLSSAMAIQQQLADSLQEVERSSEVLAHLDRITVSLNTMSDPDEVLRGLVQVLGHEIGELAVLVVPGDHGTHRIAAIDSADPLLPEMVRRVFDAGPMHEHDQGPIATVLRSGEPLLVSHVSGSDLSQRVAADARAVVVANLPRSVICVPWRVTDNTWGAVLVTRFDPARPCFDERDLSLVRQVVERHGSTYRQVQAQLETRAVSRFRELAQSAPMAILQLDAEGACTFANDQWAALTGFGPDRSLGAGWLDVFDPSDLEQLNADWIPARDKGEVFKVEVRLHTADGRTIWAGGSSVAQFGDDGHYTGALIAVSDMTARKQAEEELTRRARVDPLTGGANRFALFERIDEALAEVRHDDAMVGLLYLDLDSFKEVNDSLGHEVGDQLLLAVANRLGGVLRSADTCARVGGDEFVLLLTGLRGRADAGDVADRIRSLLRPSFQVAGMAINASASVGVATATRLDGVLRADELVRRADRAMYRAKALGRDCWEAYDPELDEQAHSEGTVRQEVADAIRNGQLVLHYQPIVDLATARMVGVEALVRIEHPTKGLLAPGHFLDVAERSGQIVAVGEWVVAEATRQLARWHEVRPDLYLTLNLSGRQIADRGAAELILRAVRANRIRPDRLVVELTETTLVRAVESAVAAVQRIRDAGVRIAIDDFGTGYSSLARLTEIPADMIKLDRSFVVHAPNDPMHAAIVSAVLHMTERVGLDVVAEGIETAEQLQTIQDLGCHVGQGFLFRRPVPAVVLDELVTGAFVTSGEAAANFRA